MIQRLLSAVTRGMCLVALLGAQSAFAQDDGRTFGQIYTDCGLGAMIASNTPAVAAVTNVTWDLGTTAISSNATSPETCQGGKAETAALIYDVYPQLEQDLARGDGQHLDALLALTGCDASVHDQLATRLRADLATTVSASGYEAQSRHERAATMHQQLYEHVDGEFVQACNVG